MCRSRAHQPDCLHSARVEFHYRLTGTGWSEARLADDRGSATITASYLSDALGELLEAVGLLLEGAPAARCSWDEEPGEYRWIFDRDEETVRLRVLGFRGLWGNEPDERGSTVFETVQTLRALASAIAAGAQTVLDEYGEEGYKAKWIEHSFPTGHLATIREKLTAL